MYDQVDERGVPVSRGVPKVVLIAVLFGIICIFAVGATVLHFAGYGHAWPSKQSARIDLKGHYTP